MKKSVQSLLILIMVLLGVHQSFGQNTIKGKIVDESQESLPGATIMIKGTSDGTVTDTDGAFTITVPDENTVLVITYTGFVTQEIRVGNQSNIDIELSSDIAQLNEVVVVGYGSQRKKDITGAVAVVDVEELEKSQFTNVTDRLQGRVPGVTVTTTGEPGVRGDIKIRGTSFFGDNNPLFVIDGILTDDSPNLNPNDIESIQILKDASSAAIYGSRAANGVVVITTKKGKEGKPVINLSSTFGIQQTTNRMEVTNSEEWARLANAYADNDGNDRQESAVNLTGIDTDWQDEVFDDAAPYRDVNLSISSGTDKSKVYFSINNANQDGIIEGPEFERFSARLNTEFNLFKRLTIGENLTVSRANTSGEQNLQGVDFDGPPVINTAVGMLPTIPVLDDTKVNGYGHGVPGVATTFIPNPVAIRDLFINESTSTRILGNVYLNYEIIEGLNYRFSLGMDANFDYMKNYWPGGQVRMTTVHRSGLNEMRGESTELFYENRLSYSKTFGKHDFTVMGTYMEQEINGAVQSTEIAGGFDSENPFFVISATTAPPNAISSAGSEFTSVIQSVLGRLTYSFDDRYLITANVRRDGSSKFSSDNRWGTFPSISAGWNISNESFFNVPAISYLKVRAGYGEVGNASIGDYLYQALILSAASGGVNYNLGPGSESVIGATRGDIVNRDIKWEVLKETNIGIDLTLFDGQLEIIGDYYFGDLEDLLTEVPIPATAGGGGSSPTINAVTMQRNGWEAAVTYRKMTGDFQYSITANAFNATNEVAALPFGVMEFPGDNSISRIGIPLGQLFVLDYQGIFTSQEQIDALGPDFTINGVTPQVGDAIYRDVNGRDEDTGQLTGQPDGKISFDDDRIIAGNPIPDVQFGLSFTGIYKNFDFTIFFQGLVGRDIYNTWYTDLNTDAGSNFSSDYDPYIDGVGSDPRPVTAETGNNLPSTRFIEDGTFYRLKNLQIGYTIPWSKVNNFRVFLSAQNVFTITDYNGLDPEFDGGVFEPGVDPQGFPNIRIFSGGFNVVF